MKESSITAFSFLTPGVFFSLTHSDTNVPAKFRFILDYDTQTDGLGSEEDSPGLCLSAKILFGGIRKLKCERHKKSAYTHIEGATEVSFLHIISQFFLLDNISVILVLIILL